MTLICHQRLSTAGLRIIALHRLGKCHFSSGSRHLRLLMKCRQICRISMNASIADPFICRCHYSSSFPTTSDKFELPDPIERDRQHWIQLLREEQRAEEQRAKNRDWFGGTTLDCKALREWKEGKPLMVLSAVGIPIETTALSKLQPQDPIELCPLGISSSTESSSLFGKFRKITPDGHLLVVLDDDHGRDWEGVRFNIRQATKVHWALELLENDWEWHTMPGFPAMLWAYGCDEEWPNPDKEEPRSLSMDEEMMRLDEHQRTALAAALDPNRPIVAVHGPPGTGKSMLAMEYVRAEIQAGKRVVVICGSNLAMYSLVGHYLQRTGSDPQLHKNILFHSAYDPKAADQLILDPKIKESIECRTMKHLLEEQGSRRIYTKYKETAPIWKVGTRSRIIRDCPLQFCTPSETTMTLITKAKSQFDVVVVEDANQLNIPDSWALILPLAPRVRLFGDSHQLAMSLNSKIARLQNFERSLLQQLEEKDDQFFQGQQVNFHLRIQYRSHPAIHHWSNTVIYPNCKSEPAPSVVNLGLAELLSEKSDSKQQRENLITEPMVLIDTSLVGNGRGGWAEWMFEEKQGGFSLKNQGEALLAASYLCLLQNAGFDPSQIALFPHYLAQQNQIMDSFSILNKNAHFFSPTQILQRRDFIGRCFDIVLNSHVKDPREVYKRPLKLQYLNHAITRARRQYVLVANSKHLRESPMSKELDELIRTFEQKGRIMAPEELLPLQLGEFEEIMKEMKNQHFDSVKRGRRDETRKRFEDWEEKKERRMKWKEAEMEEEDKRNGRRMKMRDEEEDELEEEDEERSGRRRIKMREEKEEEDEKKKSGKRMKMREEEEDELEEEEGNQMDSERIRKMREEEEELKEEGEEKNVRRKKMMREEDEDWKSIAKRDQRMIANLEMKLRKKEQIIEQLEMKLRDMRKMAKERGQSIWNLMEKLQERRKTMESLEHREVEKMAKGSQENGKDDEEEDEGERR